jgi:integrase
MADIKKRHRPDCAGTGTCSCPYRLDYRPTGVTGPRKRIEFPTKKAAERFLNETSHKVSRGEYIAPELIPTFASVAEEWMRGKVRHHPASVAGWRVHLRHLAPLDKLRLDRVDVATIERLSAVLLTGLSPKTVGSILTTAAAVFKLALRRGYAIANPAALAARPRRAVVELTGDEEAESDKGLRAIRPDEVLSTDEIGRLLEHAEPGLYRTLFALVASTGLRPEEAYALRWSDLQLGDAPQLFVRRSLSWSRGQGETGHVRPKFFEPKTKAGYRALPLAVALVVALKAWKLKCPASPHELVFPRADGEPLQRSNVLRQGLHPALRRAKLRGGNLKGLRHSYASGLIAAGAPITEVQHRLGHSSPAVTLKVYSHWLKDADTGAAGRFADGFLGKCASA